jgi:hypothetical protein
MVQRFIDKKRSKKYCLHTEYSGVTKMSSINPNHRIKLLEVNEVTSVKDVSIEDQGSSLWNEHQIETLDSPKNEEIMLRKTRIVKYNLSWNDDTTMIQSSKSNKIHLKYTKWPMKKRIGNVLRARFLLGSILDPTLTEHHHLMKRVLIKLIKILPPDMIFLKEMISKKRSFLSPG